MDKVPLIESLYGRIRPSSRLPPFKYKNYKHMLQIYIIGGLNYYYKLTIFDDGNIDGRNASGGMHDFPQFFCI